MGELDSQNNQAQWQNAAHLALLSLECQKSHEAFTRACVNASTIGGRLLSQLGQTREFQHNILKLVGVVDQESLKAELANLPTNTVFIGG